MSHRGSRPRFATCPIFQSRASCSRTSRPSSSIARCFGMRRRPWRRLSPARGISHVVAIESRGFILGAPVAQALGAAFVPFRKPGKLPHIVERVEYALEYGVDALECHRDALRGGQRVLVLDDRARDRRNRRGGVRARGVSRRDGAGVLVPGRAGVSEREREAPRPSRSSASSGTKAPRDLASYVKCVVAEHSSGVRKLCHTCHPPRNTSPSHTPLGCHGPIGACMFVRLNTIRPCSSGG